MTLPSVQVETLQPATPDEIRAALKALFDQFPAAEGDAKGKFLGYVMAMEGEPKWAVERAVRKFIRGEVPEHDGRFLPSSAELARVVRNYSDHTRKIRDLSQKHRPFATFVRSIPKTDFRFPWPGLDEFRRWDLPEHTVIVAADATVIYPNGTVEGWASVQRRRNPIREPERKAG